ncbi:MAG: hypothetical protein ACRD9R_01275 [Pyrinomonadaceae bacterium]
MTSPSNSRRRTTVWATLLVIASLCHAPLGVGQQRRRPQQQQQPPATRQQQQINTTPPGAQPQQTTPATDSSAAPMSAAERDAAGVTFDTLLAADDYAVYGEVRDVGKLFASQEIIELLATLKLTKEAPPELAALFNFLSERADTLSTSRVLFGAVPAREKLPDVLVAVEMGSPEQAENLMPELREFATTNLQSLLQSASGPQAILTTDTTAANPPRPRRRAGRRRNRAAGQNTSERPPPQQQQPAPAFHLKRAGSVVAISDRPFTFKSLRRTDDKLLSDEPSFQAARARLGAETLFLYFNLRRVEKYSEQLRKESERKVAEAQREAQRNAASGDPADEAALVAASNANMNAVVIGTRSGAVLTANTNQAGGPAVVPSDDELANLTGPAPDIIQSDAPPPAPTPTLTAEEQAKVEQQQRAQQIQSAIGMAMFGGSLLSAGGGFGSNAWPEAIAVGAALEEDALVLRALLFNASEEQPLRPIPFVPLLQSGPEIVSEAANVLPAGTDVFISASLDLPQMYDYVASSLGLLDLAAAAGGGEGTKGGSFQSALDGFQKDIGFRIKEDLLNALGHELAISFPTNWIGGPAVARRGAEKDEKEKRLRQTSPVFLVALNDKRKLQELLPKALAGFGITGVSEQQLIEKRGEVELLTYAQGTVAFIEQFLVIAPDAETMRWIADSYNGRETLASTAAFRDAMSWQPRQTLGRIYVSGDVLKSMFEDPREASELVEDEGLRGLIARLPEALGAVTHVLSKDDNKLFHELRLPKNLLARAAAEIAIGEKLAPLKGAESMARWKMHAVKSAQDSFMEANKRYASLEELKNFEGLPDYLKEDEFEVEGYELKVSASGDKFEATATPTLYRKTGRFSFYIDQTGVTRGGDLGGKAASASSEPVN